MAYLEQKLRTCWWFNEGGHEAAAYYVSLLPNSHIEGGHGPEGGPPLVLEFTLAGAPMMILNAQGAPPANHAASFSVLTEDQAETDRLWAALLADGGKEVACGWLTDRWGVSWQIAPKQLPIMLGSKDLAARTRAFEAMRTMVKLDLAALEAAFAG
jgi:predicted 3-demethylubiquinone-9 3-methyltransferase (glyoxalase superfamily)